MSRITFGTKQELKSIEFGNLLYGIVQKGVYQTPEITINEGILKVEGGSFLFYNTDSDVHYAAKVEDVSITNSETISAGKYVFIRYTYDSNIKAEPYLAFSNSATSDYSTIRLGRIIDSSGTLAVDTTPMERAGTGYSSENSFIDFLTYSPNETTNTLLEAAFNGKVITNSGVKQVDGISTESQPAFPTPDKTKAQYLYVDTNGEVKLADDTVPRFGKLVIAEKTENGSFIINRYPYLPEINTENIEAIDPDTANTDIYDSAKTATKQELDTTAEVASLYHLLRQMIIKINNLVENVSDLTARVIALEDFRTYIGKMVTLPANMHNATPTEVQFKTGLPVKSNTIVVQGSVTVDPQGPTSFGTAAQPIKNLFVEEALYTDRLFVTE